MRELQEETKWARSKTLIRPKLANLTRLDSHPRVLRITLHRDKTISHLPMAKAESPGEPTIRLMREELAPLHTAVTTSNITLPEMVQEWTSINTELATSIEAPP